jgi:hypothetical protein
VWCNFYFNGGARKEVWEPLLNTQLLVELRQDAICQRSYRADPAKLGGITEYGKEYSGRD